MALSMTFTDFFLYHAIGNMQHEKRRKVMHNISIIAPFLYEASDQTLCLQKGDYGRARLTDDEDAWLCMNYSTASRNRHPRDDRWAPRFGVLRVVIFQNSFSRRKRSCSV